MFATSVLAWAESLFVSQSVFLPVLFCVYSMSNKNKYLNIDPQPHIFKWSVLHYVSKLQRPLIFNLTFDVQLIHRINNKTNCGKINSIELKVISQCRLKIGIFIQIICYSLLFQVQKSLFENQFNNVMLSKKPLVHTAHQPSEYQLLWTICSSYSLCLN